MHRKIMLLSLVLLTLYSCEQTPTTLDTEPFLEQTEPLAFTLSITAFEFDYASRNFFFAVHAVSPDSLIVTAALSAKALASVNFSLNDQGRDADVQSQDGSLEGSWTLPDSLAAGIDSLWTLQVTALAGSDSKTVSQTLQPERPQAPVIGSIVHADTLTLDPAGIVLDTLVVTVSHPQGLDEIRDVTMMSLKPDSTWANHGQPIPLYDDGGQVVFFTFQGIDFTSGDQVAGDGKYSLLLALTADNLAGEYRWTFNSRSWQGVAADPVQDSLVVLPVPGLTAADAVLPACQGAFR